MLTFATLTLLAGASPLVQAALPFPFADNANLEPRAGAPFIAHYPAAPAQRRQESRDITVTVTSRTATTSTTTRTTSPETNSRSLLATSCSSLVSSFRAAAPTPNALVSSYLLSSASFVFSSLQSIQTQTTSSRTRNDIRTVDFSSLCSAEEAYLTARTLPNEEVATAWTSYISEFNSWRSDGGVRSEGYSIVTKCAGVMNTQLAGRFLRNIATDIEGCVSASRLSVGLGTFPVETGSVSRSTATRTEGVTVITGTVTSGGGSQETGTGNGNGSGQVSSTGSSTAAAARETGYGNVVGAAVALVAVGIAGVVA